ncbi:BC053393 [Phodopus roborovskii]|uniref:BC053393 protein n=1 Tax=Phodopus roborovskii TaxID=109678 RepID=A0AAU9Z148_PHORO|nr:BC053393 [Phodopus roborovskii]
MVSSEHIYRYTVTSRWSRLYSCISEYTYTHTYNTYIALHMYAIESFAEVHGVVGRPVTLPCTYPVSHGISPTCWGQGACFFGKCKDVVILTNGYYVYYKRNNRYHLPGKILQGNVSLTIQKVRESDSGLYCCRVEMKGWEGVHRLTISLKVQPEADGNLSVFFLNSCDYFIPNYILFLKGKQSQTNFVLLLLLVVSIMTITSK